jgi:hypothetical protein
MLGGDRDGGEADIEDEKEEEEHRDCIIAPP